MASQYLRKTSLIVYGNPSTPGGTGLAVPAAPATDAGSVGAATNTGRLYVSPNNAPAQQQPSNQPGIELGALHCEFTVSAMDLDTPPTALIRVINLAESTAQQVQKEFQSVTLQAGYEDGNFGVIFTGTIIRVKKGRLNNIDSFVDIMASNLDIVHNFGFTNTSIKAGATPQQQLDQARSSVNNSAAMQGLAGTDAQGLQYGDIPKSPVGSGGVLPRGKVMFGLWREKASDIASSNGWVWSIGPDGKVYFHPLDGYLPGDAVVINAQTGMIGVPIATTQGIEVSCLLNPKIRPGTRIQLNNADITTTNNVYKGAGYPAYSDFQSGFFANTSTDGVYVALVVEHEGDNRGHGNDWKTNIIALALDQSGNSGSGTVPAYG